jgi:sugar phosphate isomerase/epimerase
MIHSFGTIVTRVISQRLLKSRILVFPLKIGLSLASLRQPVRRAIFTAAQLGARAIEIDARGDLRPAEMTGTAVRDLRKLLNDAGLSVCAVSFLTRRGYNDMDELDRRISATKDAMRMAYELRSPIVVNRIGRVPSDAEDPAWTLLVETLSDLGRHGDRTGVTLCARTGSEDGATLAKLIDALPAGSLGVDFDPASLIVAGFSPRESLETISRHVQHVHARDAVRDPLAGRGVETPLGRGLADFPELLGLLDNMNYRGWFTVERQQSENPTMELGNAIQYLQNLV